MSDQIIIFFDGQCNLCDRFVNFVFKRDTHRHFLYAPLQGETAFRKLSREDIQGLKSIVILKDGLVLKETRAVQAVMQQIYPRCSIVFSLLPLPFFNFFYRLVGKRRYSLFGKKSHLYQPSESQKKFFLP